jgi:hypothetical protein
VVFENCSGRLRERARAVARIIYYFHNESLPVYILCAL